MVACVAGGLALAAALLQWNRIKDLERRLAAIDVDSVRTKRLTVVDDNGDPRIELGMHEGREPQIIVRDNEGVQAAIRGLDNGTGIIATFEKGRLRTSLESDSGGGKVKAFANKEIFGVLQPQYEKFETGRILRSIPLADHPAESFALWLPEGYGDGLTTPLNPRPILFLLNSKGDGPKIIEPFLEAAAERGWILAASNSYHGGMIDPSATIRRFINDVESRVAIQRGRLYAGGFSWGGFNAAWAAKAYAPKFTGTIAIGTPGTGGPGLIPHVEMLRTLPRAHHILLTGDRDTLGADIRFTYDSLMYGGKHYVVHDTFDGGHVIPPTATCGKALRSLDLIYTLSAGPKTDKDHEFVRRELGLRLDDWESRKDVDKVLSFPTVQVWTSFGPRIPGEIQERIKAAGSTVESLRKNDDILKSLKLEAEYAKALPRQTLDLGELDRSLVEMKALSERARGHHVAERVFASIKILDMLKKTTAQRLEGQR